MYAILTTLSRKLNRWKGKRHQVHHNYFTMTCIEITIQNFPSHTKWSKTVAWRTAGHLSISLSADAKRVKREKQLERE